MPIDNIIWNYNINNKDYNHVVLDLIVHLVKADIWRYHLANEMVLTNTAQTAANVRKKKGYMGTKARCFPFLSGTSRGAFVQDWGIRRSWIGNVVEGEETRENDERVLEELPKAFHAFSTDYVARPPALARQCSQAIKCFSLRSHHPSHKRGQSGDNGS